MQVLDKVFRSSVVSIILIVIIFSICNDSSVPSGAARFEAEGYNDAFLFGLILIIVIGPIILFIYPVIDGYLSSSALKNRKGKQLGIHISFIVIQVLLVTLILKPGFEHESYWIKLSISLPISWIIYFGAMHFRELINR